MKIFITVFLLTITLQVTAQNSVDSDSIEVRVQNKGKHYLKKFIVTVDGHDYKFGDVWKNKYSEYKKIPYIWTNNKSETTVIIKRIIKYDEWLTTLSWPFDHIGEEKLTRGKFTVEVSTKMKNGQLEVSKSIKKEK